MRKLLPQFGLCLVAVALSSCAVGPNYHKPSVADITPGEWRWKAVAPNDAAPRGEWWRAYNDPTLNELESTALTNNQDLRAAVARIDQAMASARITRNKFLPEVTANGSINRQRTSGNQPTAVPLNVPAAQLTTYQGTLDLSYEIDFWGKVRRSYQSATATAQANVADYQSVLLELAANVAINYFDLRAYDTEIGVLRRTLSLRQDYYQMTRQRYEAGTIGEADLSREAEQVASAKAQLLARERERLETQNTLALLCGRAATGLEIAEQPLNTKPPEVPAGLPADLVERRPDVAKAERTLAARNAEIGAVVANYFPAIQLTAEGGYLSGQTSTLLKGPSRVWSIGPSVSLPILSHGSTRASVRKARAAYEEALANYRQSVLSAFKDVEDSLAQIHYRGEEAKACAEEVSAAQRTLESTRSRVEAGVISNLEEIDAERTRLEAEISQSQVVKEHLVASVRLIKALGGGWSLAQANTSPPKSAYRN